MSPREAYRNATADDSKRPRLTAAGWTFPVDQTTRACHCVGPQDGNPVCPCRMPALRIQHGRYVEIIDHGPAPAEDIATD